MILLLPCLPPFVVDTIVTCVGASCRSVVLLLTPSDSIWCAPFLYSLQDRMLSKVKHNSKEDKIIVLTRLHQSWFYQATHSIHYSILSFLFTIFWKHEDRMFSCCWKDHTVFLKYPWWKMSPACGLSSSPQRLVLALWVVVMVGMGVYNPDWLRAFTIILFLNQQLFFFLKLSNPTEI